MFVGENCGKAEEAIKLYTSLFLNSEIKKIDYFKAAEQGGKEGMVKHAIFTIGKQEYMAIDSMGHDFTFTQAISIQVNCDSEEEINNIYNKLLEGGKALMPIDNYGFSTKFGWVTDKLGLSWQLNLK